MSFRRQSGARADVYTRITDEIIAAIEDGAGEWRAPWFHNGTNAARPSNVAESRVLSLCRLSTAPTGIA